jgi:hypothetical protein
MQLSMQSPVGTAATVSRSSSTDDVALQDLDLDGLEALATTTPSSYGGPGAFASASSVGFGSGAPSPNIPRLRQCIGELKTIRDVLLGRLPDDFST